MNWSASLYAFILYACALATMSVVVPAWRQRAQVGPGPALALLGTMIWSVGYAVAIGVRDLDGRIWWAKVQHIGIALASVAAAVFLVQYAGRSRWLTGRHLLALAFVPGIGLGLTWTNQAHHLIWREITVRQVGPLTLLDIAYGPYFWFYAAYNYLVLLSGIMVFAHAALTAPYLQRQQARIMLIGLLVPGAAMLIYLTGLSPIPGLDLAPLGYSIGGLVLAWGLFRYRLFDIVPVAREIVIENLSDAVVVADVQDRIVDVNPAGLAMLGRTRHEVIGRTAGMVLNDWPGARLILDQLRRSGGETEFRQPLEIGTRWYDLRVSPLVDTTGQLAARIISVRDITSHRLAEQATRQMAVLQERERLARELHDSVTQSLYGVTLLAAAANAAAGSGELAQVRQDVTDLGAIAQAALKEMRLLIYELRPQELEQDGLVGALGRRLEIVENRAGIATHLQIAGPLALSAEIESQVYRVTQEALNNVLKHAHASEVRVWIGREGTNLAVEIRDNGRGFDCAGVRGGIGMTSMQERIAQLGGELIITSEPGTGTCVRLVVPLERAAINMGEEHP